MITKQVNLNFTKRQTHRTIAATACWHVGNPNCKEENIERLMDKCNAEKMPWIHLGDIIEAIGPTDSRFHCETHEKSILAQTAEAATHVMRAKKYLIGMVLGNHEEKLDRTIGWTIKDILERVYHDPTKAFERNLCGLAFIDFICPSGSCMGMFAHSKISMGIGRSTSEPEELVALKRENKLRNLLKCFDADLKIVAHGHRSVIAPPVVRPKLSVEGTDRGPRSVMRRDVERPEWCAMCPSMFGNYEVSTSYPSYAEMALYPPTDIGWLEVDLGRDGTVLEVRSVE